MQSTDNYPEGISPGKDKPVYREDNRYWKNTAIYDNDTFPKIAYEVLSKKGMQSLTHVAVALQCARSSIYDWMKKHPDFKESVEKGLAAGEAIFREKIGKAAFNPTAEVNNGLIKMLAGNVYGIREETTVVVEDKRTEKDPEQYLKEKNIPIPKPEIEDIDFENEEGLEF